MLKWPSLEYTDHEIQFGIKFAVKVIAVTGLPSVGEAAKGRNGVTCDEGHEGGRIYDGSRHLVSISSPIVAVIYLSAGESFKPKFAVRLEKSIQIRCPPALYLNAQQICDDAEGSEPTPRKLYRTP